MVDSPPGRAGPGPGRCPWCSAPLPEGISGTCPSCGAALETGEDLQIPGVTTIDPHALLRRRRPVRSRRLLAFLLGEEPDEGTGSDVPSP